MGKYFVPLAMLTLADRLRESLGKAAAVVDSLRELSPEFLRGLIDRRPG